MAILNPGDKGPCEHYNFYSQCRVGRLTDGEDGPVTGYHADIKIKCMDCGQSFEFVGLPGGFNFQKPTVSFDATEARLPIKPSVHDADFLNRNLIEN